ncbi:hypothetical protein BRC63_01460 [Halobacteriales archaeon QH_10_70_21]|nr:MAG: hypothetical protein BRC63_01460 [Halobacteriales archaeon QH_10_70_21]
MNHLAVAGDERWRLAPHAHVIVHETSDGNEFITIYDCAKLREESVLVRQDDDHWVIRADG